MICAGCKRELGVGDEYIKFTASEWAARTEGATPLEGFDDLIGEIMGSGHGDNIVYCTDCTQTTEDGWMVDTVYGDEEP